MQRLFHPVGAGQPAADTQDTLLPDLQVRIIRRNGWTLCIKGGHNGESHNHNDVGSLMVYVDGHPLLVDAGNIVHAADPGGGGVDAAHRADADGRPAGVEPLDVEAR